MDKQTISLVILCILLIVFWEPIINFVRPPQPSSRPFSTNQVAASSASPQSQGNPIPSYKGILDSISTNFVAEIETVPLENNHVLVRFTSQGGGIEDITLKSFSQNGKGPVILNTGSPLPAMACEVSDATFLAPYELTVVAPNQLRAVYQSPRGFQILKEYTLKADYQIDVSVSLQNAGPTAITNTILRVALGMGAPMNKPADLDFIGLSFVSQGKASHQYLRALQTQMEKQQKSFEKTEPVEWAAVKDQYFTFLTTPEVPFAAIRAESFALPSGEPTDTPQNQHGLLALADTSSVQLSPDSSTNWVFHLYAGPKEYKTLTSLGKGQGQILDFGMFGIFSEALLWLMNIFFGVFHNWGVAIIGVTVVIKVIFWPLTAISTRSMKQMQSLAPKMAELKEKYKDNSKKVNEEMIRMYREHKINPMAGCLPMIIQIPIFFAFYNLLNAAVELRGASFLWISDLSIADTVGHLPGLGFEINLMPLIMAVTMIWQTRITPQAPNADPSMKIMMWMMPVMFLFICYKFSSGLSLYWTAQNLLTILQTYLTRDKPLEAPQRVKTKGGFTFGRPVNTKKK